jgi:hypothetical protein
MISNFLERAIAAVGTATAPVVDDTALRVNITGKNAGSITALLVGLLPWVGLVAGALAFAYLLYSGFLYLTAGGNAESAKKGQTGILNAILGLVIIGIAYTLTTALVGTLNGTQ